MSPEERGYGEYLNSPNIMLKKLVSLFKLVLFVLRGWEHVASISGDFEIYRTYRYYYVGQSNLSKKSFRKFLKENYCRSLYKALYLLRESFYGVDMYEPYNPVVRNICLNIYSYNTWGEQVFSYKVYKDGKAFIGGFTRCIWGIEPLEEFMKERNMERYSDRSLQSAWERYLELELSEEFYDEDLALIPEGITL